MEKDIERSEAEVAFKMRKDFIKKAHHWILFAGNERSSTYYDAKNISYPSKNIARVWTIWIGTEKRDENIDHSIFLIEIAYTEKKARPISIGRYDENGKEISYYSEPLEWESIEPDSIINVLYENVWKKGIA